VSCAAVSVDALRSCRMVAGRAYPNHPRLSCGLSFIGPAKRMESTESRPGGPSATSGSIRSKSALDAVVGHGCLSALCVGAMRINQRVAKLAVVPYQYVELATGIAGLAALALQCRHGHRV
jgi:hypothetical protein